MHEGTCEIYQLWKYCQQKTERTVQSSESVVTIETQYAPQVMFWLDFPPNMARLTVAKFKRGKQSIPSHILHNSD